MKPDVGRLLAFVFLAAGSVVMLLPLGWMVALSLASPEEALRAAAGGGSFHWWPDDPRWENYPEALRRLGAGDPEHPWSGFLDALANTVVVTTTVVAAQVLSSSLAGYAFARLRFRGRDALFLLLLSTMMLPAQVTMIPLFLLFRSLGWIDTLLPLVAPSFFGTAYFIFLFRQFMAQVPQELLDAARVDGVGFVGIWWRILLPMCRPVIAITAIFTFIGTWNDFLHPLIYLHSQEKMTLAVALAGFRNQYDNVGEVHLLMAASAVTMIPCVLLFLVAQRQLVRGVGQASADAAAPERRR